jgi:hypothetical protein
MKPARFQIERNIIKMDSISAEAPSIKNRHSYFAIFFRHSTTVYNDHDDSDISPFQYRID